MITILIQKIVYQHCMPGYFSMALKFKLRTEETVYTSLSVLSFWDYSVYVSLLGMANIKIILFLSLQINTCTGIYSTYHPLSTKV